MHIQARAVSDIRLATSSDLAAIQAIVALAYGRYVPLIGRKPGPMLDDYAALIEGQHAYVMWDGGDIVGVLVLIAEAEAMLLDNVAVHPDAQGRGHGRALIAFAEGLARKRGFKAVRLYTNEAMTENIALYGQLGFVETHRGDEKGFRRVYMTKRMDP